MVLETILPVAGGAALARDDDGRVVFVTGALPGERVEVHVVESKRDFARARVVTVLEASPDRVTPPCPHVARGCGGCDLQHIDPVAQPTLKAEIVADALRRIGKLTDPVVDVGESLPATGFRTTVRCAVADGRAGFRQSKSHEVVQVDHCLVAHPLVDELIAGGVYLGLDEVTFRVGAATGERLLIAAPRADNVQLPETALDVVLIGDDDLSKRKPAHFHEEVEGVRFRISARSFFQTRTDGAAALAAAVRKAGGDELRNANAVVDAYCGVALLAVLAAPPTASVFAIESAKSSVSDARHNLEVAERRAQVVKSTVERWKPQPCDVVLADPSRTGLGQAAVETLIGTRARVIVLVSCDPAALARDAALLKAHGYRLEHSTLVDMFPQTHHIEVVSRFVR